METNDTKKVLHAMASADTIGDFLELWLTHDLLPPEQQKILKTYYRSYVKSFGPYIKRAYSEQTKELLTIAPQLVNPKILEIGAGCGTEVLWLALKGLSIVGIDIDDSFLTVARARQKLLEQYLGYSLPCKFINKSVLDLDDTEKLDVIFMEQAFHHLEPREQVVDKLARAVSKNGYVVISEANFWNPLNQLLMFTVRGFKTIGEFEGHPIGMERLLPASTLNRHFSKRGFKKVSTRYFRILPNIKGITALGFIDTCMPSWFRPIFTHYNVVVQKI